MFIWNNWFCWTCTCFPSWVVLSMIIGCYHLVSLSCSGIILLDLGDRGKRSIQVGRSEITQSRLGVSFTQTDVVLWESMPGKGHLCARSMTCIYTSAYLVHQQWNLCMINPLRCSLVYSAHFVLLSYSDSSATDYTNWGTGQPNNLQGRQDCVSIYSRYSGYWNDDYCSSKHAYICKKILGEKPVLFCHLLYSAYMFLLWLRCSW